MQMLLKQVQLKQTGAGGKAMEGASTAADKDLIASMGEQVTDADSAMELFEQELLKTAQDMYGEAEMVSEENGIKKFLAADGTEFSIEQSGDELTDTMSLNFDDGSSISMNYREEEDGGLSIFRKGAEGEDGVSDFTFTDSYVQREGTQEMGTDANGEDMVVQNYDEINVDGNDKEGVMTELYNDGTTGSQWEKDGVSHLLVSNDELSKGAEMYTSEDGYEEATHLGEEELSEDAIGRRDALLETLRGGETEEVEAEVEPEAEALEEEDGPQTLLEIEQERRDENADILTGGLDADIVGDAGAEGVGAEMSLDEQIALKQNLELQLNELGTDSSEEGKAKSAEVSAELAKVESSIAELTKQSEAA